MCDSSRSARGFRVPSNRNNPHPAPGWRWRAAQWAAVALPAALHSEKIRPRARPPAPAYGVRCPPRPAMQSIANGSAKFSVRSLTAFFGPDLPFANRSHPKNRTAARKPRSTIARPSAAPRGGRNFVAAPPATGPSPKKNLARRSLSARLGDSFYFAISKIVESLLRRGARCRSALENWSLLRQLPPCG